MEKRTTEELVEHIRRIREMASCGTMMQEITAELEVSEEYVSNIMLCLQGYAEDDDFAVARLVEMGL